MTYEDELAFHLRQRGVPEPEIAEIVEDIRAHSAISDVPPESEFGSAQEYAAQFDRKKTVTPGKHIVRIAVILALIYFVTLFFAKPVFDINVQEIVGPITMWPALALCALGVMTGFLVDFIRQAPHTRE